jgi:hypothetical protein
MRLRCTAQLSSVAAMLVLGSSLFAQDTTKTKPKSSTRIPISKEAPGEVVTPRVDTVTLYKTDTLRLNSTTTRVDTVTVTNTLTRVDTVSVTPPVPPLRLPGGFYFGLGGGVMAPNGAIYNPNNAGPSAQAQLGWEGAKTLLGLRIDANWSKPGEDAFYSGYQGDPDIINVSGDVKLNVPFLHHLLGLSPRFKLYGIGGISSISFKNLPMRLDVGTACPADRQCASPYPGVNVLVGDTDWQHDWGWNAGGGASVGFRRLEIFAETRVIAWNKEFSPQSRQMPFVLGVNLY